MKYMLIIYGTHEAWNTLDQNTIDRIGGAHKSLQSELTASGELIDHKELAVDNAKIVTSDGVDLVITDGPFTEARQILGGYYLIDCADLDRATQIAGRFVEAEFAPIEVRQLSSETSWDTRTPGPAN